MGCEPRSWYSLFPEKEVGGMSWNHIELGKPSRTWRWNPRWDLARGLEGAGEEGNR